MGQQVLVEIRPEELKFTFERKKQSLCSIQLFNKSIEFVAFKVKTTSPKRYYVLPNRGIILPRSTCNFTVTMLAHQEAPPDVLLKDKFLVQSTIVPFGSTDEDIVPSFFSKENGRYLQENKMRVALVSPPQPNNATLNHEPAGPPVSEETPILNNESMKAEPTYQNPFHVSANATMQEEPVYQVPTLKTYTSSTGAMRQETIFEPPLLSETAILSDQAVNTAADVLSIDVAKDVYELKLKHNNHVVKLNDVEKTIMRLKEENNSIIKETEKLQKEIVFWRRKIAATGRAGFPFLFVVFTVLNSLVLGYLLHM